MPAVIRFRNARPGNATRIHRGRAGEHAFAITEILENVIHYTIQTLIRKFEAIASGIIAFTRRNTREWRCTATTALRLGLVTPVPAECPPGKSRVIRGLACGDELETIPALTVTGEGNAVDV
jgi:hypothetical protein